MTRPRTLATAVLVVLAAVLAACGDDGDDAAPRPPAPTGPATPTTVGEPPAIDWADIGTVDLGDGWTLADAEGDGPFVAIERDGAAVGVIEIARFPVATIAAITAVLDAGGTDTEALEAYAEEYRAIFETDRAEGCGPGYPYIPEPTTAVDGADGAIVRYGFAGGEPVTERHLHWAGIRGGDLVLVTVSAFDADSCLPPEGPGLTVADLDGVEPRLAAAIEASPLPA